MRDSDLNELRSLLGSGFRELDPVEERAGCRLRVSLEPRSSDELAESLALLSAHRQSVLLMGAGTRLDLGNPIRDTSIALSCRLLSGVDELDEENVAEMIGKMTREEAVEFFVNAGVPAAPVYDVDEVVKDPHLDAREMFVEVEHPKAGTVKVPNFPIKYSETPGRIFKAAPLLGEHNREILGRLGLSDERIKELERTGIISSTP